jgi:hypothetical protein
MSNYFLFYQFLGLTSLYSLHNQKLLEKSNQKKIVQESKAQQEISSLTPGKQKQEEEGIYICLYVCQSAC